MSLEVEAFTTLSDSSLKYVLRVFFSVREMEPRFRRRSVRQMLKSLGLAKHSRLGLQLARCFACQNAEKQGTEALCSQFISLVSYVLSQGGFEE
mmetsp:Transcript_8272/g.15346  ORF Transcript_8272/g.15346 Transcript_8272/m.15346 type:complete len:94 (-) Transcript_8272:334-615(-)